MSANRGLTLIEVLVTLVILTLGLLGLSGLIVKAGKLNFESYERQQALAIASDMAERMHANQSPNLAAAANLASARVYADNAPVAAALGDPAVASLWSALLGGLMNDCGTTASCTPAQLALYDLAVWEGQLLGAGKRSGGTGVGGISNARGCIEAPPAPPAVMMLSRNIAAPVNTFRITVAWQGDQPVPVSGTADEDLRNVASCGQGLYVSHDGAPEGDRYRRLIVLYQVVG